MPRRTAILVGLVAAAALYVLAYPFTRAHYPPMTDLPFHAASASILRHYFDPAFHFREQFQIEPLKSPYWTFYLLGAALAVPFSIATAMKLASIVLLACLPLGLACLFHGMKKSSLLGFALGLLWVWNTQAHLGFLSFTAAVGLMCAAMGLTMRLVDEPTPRRQRALALVLVLALVTHGFQLPLALLAVATTTLLLYPATRRLLPPLLATLPSLLLFGVWFAFRDAGGPRPADFFGPAEWLRHHHGVIDNLLFGGTRAPDERAGAKLVYAALAVAFVVNGALFLVEGRARGWSGRDRRFTLGANGAVGLLAACAYACYLTMPMTVGLWFWVYPRELFTAAVLVTALVPDLPRPSGLRAVLLLIVCLGALPMARFVARQYAAFDRATDDFRAITQRLPPAPRLAYLVLDHAGSDFRRSSFVHLPAWVQAEKGGWLSFHFVSWNQSPIRYRTDSRAVPPPTPPRFEWQPDKFDLEERGAFFDWFLVRSPTDPGVRLAVDPTLRPVDHAGTWWLYQRTPRP